MNKTPKAKQNIITRGLPKTGQTTTYQAGDDGFYEAGWWKGRLDSNNKVRLVAKTIGGDDVVIDRATGLMWAADGNDAGCNSGNTILWGPAITYAEGLTFAGFTDWRVPNVKELMSIINFSLSSPTIDNTKFVNTYSNYYWTSTTNIPNTIAAWYITFGFGFVLSTSKTFFDVRLRCVRGGP